MTGNIAILRMIMNILIIIISIISTVIILIITTIIIHPVIVKNIVMIQLWWTSLWHCCCCCAGMQRPSIFCTSLSMQVEIHVFIAFQIHWTGTKPFDIFQGQVMTSQSGGIWPPTVGNWQIIFVSGRSFIREMLLMEDIRRSPVAVGSLSHYLQNLLHPRWLAGFLPSTLSRDSFCGSTSKLTFCVRLERDTGKESHSKDGIGSLNPGRGLDSQGLWLLLLLLLLLMLMLLLLLLLLLLRDCRIHQGLLVS